MAFKLDIHRKRRISNYMDNIRTKYRELFEHKDVITLEDWKTHVKSHNAWEQSWLMMKADKELLLYLLEQYLKNVSKLEYSLYSNDFPITYDDGILRIIAPRLVKLHNQETFSEDWNKE